MGKAVEGHRSPRRWRVFQRSPDLAKLRGVRQPSGALAGDGIQMGGFFNATGLAEIRLVALESDLSRRNRMKAEDAGKLESFFASAHCLSRRSLTKADGDFVLSFGAGWT